MPKQFTPAEQTEFVNFVRQPRFISRDEQHEKFSQIFRERYVERNRRGSKRTSRRRR